MDAKANRVAMVVTETPVNSHISCIKYLSALQQQQQILLRTLPLASLMFGIKVYKHSPAECL